MAVLNKRLLHFFLVLILAACSSPSEESQTEVSNENTKKVPDLAAITANNRGVGLMGKFEYEPARKVFAELVQTYPNWLDVKVNQAIAILNRQREGDETAALAIADEVLDTDPTHLRAHYVAGLLRLYLASPTEALDHFKQVAEGDPEDAYAAYYLAQTLAQQGNHQQALHWYRQAIQLEPYLRSAYYGAFQSLQRLKKAKEARELIADYQRLANNPRARLAEFKYTRMGPKGEALAMDSDSTEVIPPLEGAVFAEMAPLPITDRTLLPHRRRITDRPLSITAVDLHDDDRLDLFIPRAFSGEEAPNLVLVGQPDKVFSADPTHPLAKIPHVNAALWGDFDNDGLTDVYLARQGPNQLWHQPEQGRWREVSESTKTSGGQFNTVDGAFFDADHDGDLDLFLVNADGPNELLSNNLDGTFRPLAMQQGIAGEGQDSRTLVPVDIDRDRDVDLVVINRQPPHEVYLNDRLWAYRAAAGFDLFLSTPALTAIAGDLDSDGQPELYTVTPDGVLYRWQPDTEARFQPVKLDQFNLDGGRWAQLATADVNGDGLVELIVTTTAGWRVLNEGNLVSQATLKTQTKLVSSLPVLLEPPSGPAIVGMDTEGQLSIWSPGTGRHLFLAFQLTGKEDTAQSMRSNASGIGAQVAIRTGSHWTLAQTYRNHSGPGQSLQPLAVGLGGVAKADFVAIDWSDGVFQSELDLEVGKVHPIPETQRQLSSCPVLFAWDGERYAFVSDLLGVGGLGYAVGPDEYAIPRPWENFLFAPGLLKPKDGQFLLKLTEPMEEIAYLDEARLVAYDLPPGWHMVLDERMGILEPQPTGEALFYRKELMPVRALNERGEVVTKTLTQADGKAAPVSELDRRFIGRLQGEHVLTLTFPEAIDGMPAKPILIVDGWVEYPYSQTMFAAWQAGAHFDAPTLEAQGADGKWHTVLKQFGYPAGMPRRMSVPLNKLPIGTSRLRIRTNMEVYWDRVAIAFAEPLSQARRQVLTLKSAKQAKTGFAYRTTGTQRQPHYDYEQRTPFWDTRYMAGYYTRLGSVEELVNRADDAVAIIGPGEEVQLAFDEPTVAPPEGWVRHHVLEIHGWTKDMDLFTKDGETVGPLPTTGQPTGPRDLLHARYHTRYLAGR